MAKESTGFRRKFVPLAKMVEHPNFQKIEVHASYGRIIQFARDGITFNLPYSFAGTSVLFTEFITGQYAYKVENKGLSSTPAQFTGLINELTTGTKKIEAPIFIGGNQLINRDQFEHFKIGCTTITYQDMRGIIEFVAPKVGYKVTDIRKARHL
jgi:hypothetical protein